jgi:hypothetical protein
LNFPIWRGDIFPHPANVTPGLAFDLITSLTGDLPRLSA